jgi:hypothetical protein
MSSTDLVLRVVAILDQLSIPNILVGSYSSNYYGRPRMTQDADFVVAMAPNQFTDVRAALGPEFYVDPQMSFETKTMTTRYVVTHRASTFKIELFLLADDPFAQMRFQRRRVVDFEGQKVWLPTPEDVVIQKLRWSRPKDLDDAAQVIAMQREKLDLAYIREWTDRHQTRQKFEEMFGQAKS